MAGMTIETMIYAAGLVLTLGALAGLGWMGVSELRVRAVRRSRLAGVSVGGGGNGPMIERAGGGISDQVLSTVRRLGQQSAVRDPAKVSVLRSRLMQAGFYAREAPVFFLGVKAIALACATLGVVLTLPAMIS